MTVRIIIEIDASGDVLVTLPPNNDSPNGGRKAPGGKKITAKEARKALYAIGKNLNDPLHGRLYAVLEPYMEKTGDYTLSVLYKLSEDEVVEVYRHVKEGL